MMYWRDIIWLYEMRDVAPELLPMNMSPGIHYSAKAITDRSQLLSDIERALDQTMVSHIVPAGYVNGRLTEDTVSHGHDGHEVDTLYGRGINPIVRRHGVSYLWGMKFFSGTAVSMMVDECGLTIAFKAFLARMGKMDVYPAGAAGAVNTGAMTAHVYPLKTALSPRKVVSISLAPPVEPTVKRLPIHRALTAKPGQYGLYIPGLET
jgi:hypothetical protein